MVAGEDAFGDEDDEDDGEGEKADEDDEEGGKADEDDGVCVPHDDDDDDGDGSDSEEEEGDGTSPQLPAIRGQHMLPGAAPMHSPVQTGAVEPIASPYLPAGQSSHNVAPCLLYLPLEHGPAH